MGSIGRYIFRATFGAFVLVLVSLTAVIWVTQALRDIDLLTNQGQTVLVFIGITAMIIPQLMLIIAPIAVVIAVAHVLNKMSTDSEIIVMSAAGVSPWVVFRAFIAVALAVSVFVAILSTYVAPLGLRNLRSSLREVSADLVTNIVQPGRFTTVENSLTFHIRERRSDGVLLGVFVDDQRNRQERVTILAQQGEVVEQGAGKFLILQKGSLQRQAASQPDPTIVLFDSYAFDLSRFSGAMQARYSVRERFFWELLKPDPADPQAAQQAGQYRAEINDRIVAPFYPLAFVMLAFAYLGAPRTTRQSRTLSLLGVIGAVASLRLIGFVGTVFGVSTPWTLALPYAAVAVALAFSIWVVARGVVIEPPAWFTRLISTLSERFNRAAAPT